MPYRGVIGVVNVFFNYLIPSKIILIDVREESPYWLEWLQDKKIHTISWIESDIDRYKILRQKISSESDISLQFQTVATKPGELTYFLTSFNQENGLISPERLQRVWKNIIVKDIEKRNAISLNECIDDSKNRQWLIVDSLNGTSLLNSLNDASLEEVDLIVVRMIVDTDSRSLNNLTDKLTKNGFIQIELCATDNPSIIRVIYLRDYPKLFYSLDKEHIEFIEQYEEQCDTKFDLETEYAELLEEFKKQEKILEDYQSLEQSSRNLQDSLTRLSQEKNTLGMQYNQLIKDYKQLNQDNMSLNEQLEIQHNLFKYSEKSFNKVYTFFETLLSQNKSLNDQIISFNEKLTQNTASNQKLINKAHINTVSQIENYIALNNYLNTGTKLASYHGWPISPDIAVFIVDLMNEKEYDAVIEFGSGTSTELFAKVALMRQKKNQKVPKILSFDHLSEYYEKTQALLNRENLAEFVQLECTPLMPIKLQNIDYQYYDCKQILQVFLSDLPADAKILVLVDGPPGATCKHARYPALPLLIKVIGNKKINLDIVLDDAYRAEEKEVLQKWIEYLKPYKYQYKSSIPRLSEKGLLLLSINN